MNDLRSTLIWNDPIPIISDLQLFKVIFTCIPDKFKEDLGP